MHRTLRPGVTCLPLLLVAAGCVTEGGAPFATRLPGEIRLYSDHEALAEGFEWARATSLGYARTGDPVGPWFEAALPGREAFCMRDVSHQAEGALALGLYEHTLNMMRKFAASISDSRDWCGYWEIDRFDRPAPVDYRSDSDFWYNLPANFDLVQASERAWQWTGDSTWLTDRQLEEFRRRTLSDYVRRWDADGDGIVQSPESAGIRGIPTYWEGEGRRPATGADLVAAQYAANVAYAVILKARGETEHAAAEGLEREADRLRRVFDDSWWSEELGRFYASRLPDGTFDTADVPAMQTFALYFGIAVPERADHLFEDLRPGVNVEERSYLAEAHYRYGRDAEAFRYLLDQMAPGLQRREYPENPFTAVGASVRWLAGVRPLASEAVVETRPRLPAEVRWLELRDVPVLDGSLSVRHEGQASTRVTRGSGTWTRWRAVLPGAHDSLLVDGRAVSAASRRGPGGAVESYVDVLLRSGEAKTVATPDP